MRYFVFKVRPIFCVGVLTLCLFALLSFGTPRDIVQTFCAPNGRQLPVYSVETDEKKVALGINCAWDEQDILPMLSTLKEQNCQATFFLLGSWAQKYPEEARAISLSNQEIGSHSHTHRDMDSLSEEEINNEILSSQKAIEAVCGQKPILFRPPSGAYNDLVISCIHKNNCVPIQWSIDTLDWKGLSSEEIVSRVTEKLSPGAIILMHAGAKHSAEALKPMISAIRDAGYQIVPVGKLLSPEKTKIDNNGNLFS